MLELATPPADLRPLRAHCSGDLVVAGEPGWDAALRTWDGLEPGDEPAAIAFPAGGYDERAVLDYVRFAGLRTVRAGSDDPDDDLDGVVLVHRPATPPPWR
jgi:hypothetical protein